MTRPILGVAVVGAGYWGPNLIRNFSACEAVDLRWVCDLSIEKARKAVGRYSTVRTTDDLAAVLEDPTVEAVAIATPAATHTRLAMQALAANRHVLVEKPLATTVADGKKLVAEARKRGLTLMIDHTYCYTPAVRRLRDLLRGGELGDLQYIDSVRINLGLVQPDVDVFWDLAPHDLSILDFILPDDRRPQAVAAQGADPLETGRVSVGYLTLPLDGGAIAHLHVNWLSPTKIRTTLVGGSKRIALWDDLDPSQRLTMYDRGVDVLRPVGDNARREALVSYRLGDMVAPALPEGEALGQVVAEFVASIRERRQPLTDGQSGLRVLEILDQIPRSLALGGACVPLPDATGRREDTRIEEAWNTVAS
jgi:predicted dehydrogenase